MFRQISTRIALQFTAFVFVLFLVNGIFFLIADFGNARRMNHDFLERTSRMVLHEAQEAIQGRPMMLPPHIRDRVRIVGTSGQVLQAGNIFFDIPLPQSEGYTTRQVQDEDMMIFTVPVMQDDKPMGYAQIINFERQQLGDLPVRALVYLIVSAIISILTYGVGIFFARRSLRPAEESMRRLEQFTQDASHELRTPLAALKSSLGLALKNKKYKEGIDSALEDVDEVTVLVERLLELTRLDSLTLKKDSIDFSALVSGVTEKHKLLAKEKNMTIETDIANNIRVPGDAALLKQVVANLLQNAVKFGMKNGTVHVTLSKDTLTVRDDGAGIAAKHLPHIFDRFYQADDSRSNEGFGLGLSLVKRITELHGWNITVESGKKTGAVFMVKFG